MAVSGLWSHEGQRSQSCVKGVLLTVYRRKNNFPASIISSSTRNFLIVSGYRHVRLRTPSNQPLEVSSLFIYSCQTELQPTHSPMLQPGAGSKTGSINKQTARPLLDWIREVGEAKSNKKEVITNYTNGYYIMIIYLLE